MPVGTWRLEAEVGGVGWDNHTTDRDRVRHRETVIEAVTLTRRLTPNFDVQLGFDDWGESSVQLDADQDRLSGWGDGWLRAKGDFYGDEERGSAWAALPYVRVPLANEEIGNGAWEPGTAIVFGRSLRDDFWFEAMVAVDWLRGGAWSVRDDVVGQCGLRGTVGVVRGNRHQL
ncbi:MAG: hypothetical protein J6386_21225 [Candidatus Synoicihabitans palmerolidicus]|nr:hypothetical protein [Candidatus Synoicihabitans palmerolidicus]